MGGKFQNMGLINKGQRPYDFEPALEHGLTGHHGTDMPRIKHIDKKGFNDIIFCMTKGECAATQFIGNFKKSFTSMPGAQETWINLITRIMGTRAIIGNLNPQGISQVIAIFSKPVSIAVFESGININRYQ